VLCQRTFSSIFRAVFLHSYTAQFNVECMGPFRCFSGSILIETPPTRAVIIVLDSPVQVGIQYTCDQLCMYIKGSTAEIQTPTHLNPMGPTITFPLPVLSPNSILRILFCKDRAFCSIVCIITNVNAQYIYLFILSRPYMFRAYIVTGHSRTILARKQTPYSADNNQLPIWTRAS
jgi:hypothetical protein